MTYWKEIQFKMITAILLIVLGVFYKLAEEEEAERENYEKIR